MDGSVAERRTASKIGCQTEHPKKKHLLQPHRANREKNTDDKHP
ncbi:hypothetical protein LINPERHAP2_LOCUS18226 [Linum perenne]